MWLEEHITDGAKGWLTEHHDRVGGAEGAQAEVARKDKKKKEKSKAKLGRDCQSVVTQREVLGKAFV